MYIFIKNNLIFYFIDRIKKNCVDIILCLDYLK